MKEDFAYSKRMHYEKTVAPAKRKARVEVTAALVAVAVLVFLGVNGYYVHWF